MCGRNAISPSVRVTLLVLVGLIAGSSQALVRGQSSFPSNLELLGDLAVGCIGDVPDSLSSFILESGGRMPFLRPPLTDFWRRNGKQVFLPDSTVAHRLPDELSSLKYTPEDGGVVYAPADDAQLERMVSLTISYRLLAPTGLLLDEGRCHDRRLDTISRDEVLLVERDPFPETRGEVPPRGSWRDWAEPVALGVAVGVVAYLFFSVRSS